MTALRTITLAALVLASCSKAPEDAAPKPEASAEAPRAPSASPSPTKVDPHAAIHEDPEREPPPMATPVGTFEATIDGKATTFSRLPRGQNRAISMPDRGVARVSIAAAETDAGWPHMRLVLEGLQLDAVDLPITLPSDAAATKDVTINVRYQVNENRIYTADAEAGGEIAVTLESFAGNRLTGTFEGKLAPTAAGLGAPIPVSGSFSVGLGLRGVMPRPSAEGSDPSTGAPNSHEIPAAPLPEGGADGKEGDAAAADDAPSSKTTP